MCPDESGSDAFADAALLVLKEMGHCGLASHNNLLAAASGPQAQGYGDGGKIQA
jgi:hypothetical protein